MAKEKKKQAIESEKYLNKWKSIEDKILSARPFGMSPDTLNKQQLSEFGNETTAIYKAKTLREIVPLLKKFWNKWEFIFSRYRFDDEGSALSIKRHLIKLAESEPKLSIRISEYPNTFEGGMELIRDLERELAKVTSGETGGGIKTTPETERNAAINIQNFRGILGNVQAENVQTGNHSSVDKNVEIEKKKKGIIKILLGVIGTIIIAIIAAAVVDIIGRFGWFDKIYSIFGSK